MKKILNKQAVKNKSYTSSKIVRKSHFSTKITATREPSFVSGHKLKTSKCSPCQCFISNFKGLISEASLSKS